MRLVTVIASSRQCGDVAIPARPKNNPRSMQSDNTPPKESHRDRKKRRRALTGPPAWWTAAEALEAEGRTDEAVALVDRECKFQGALLSQAELWARAMRRALEAGDRSAARTAWEKSSNLAYAYAASATSGGEGTALSKERDAFLARLGPEPRDR